MRRNQSPLDRLLEELASEKAVKQIARFMSLCSRSRGCDRADPMLVVEAVKAVDGPAAEAAAALLAPGIELHDLYETASLINRLIAPIVSVSGQGSQVRLGVGCSNRLGRLCRRLARIAGHAATLIKAGEAARAAVTAVLADEATVVELQVCTCSAMEGCLESVEAAAGLAEDLMTLATRFGLGGEPGRDFRVSQSKTTLVEGGSVRSLICLCLALLLPLYTPGSEEG